MNSNSPIKLRIPRQDLTTFSLFKLDVESAQRWSQALPVANTRQVAEQLREALEQLNRVQLAPELRFSILEALRPGLQLALSSLSRRYLNQPLVLPPEPRQMAALVARIYQLGSIAYTLVAIHAIQQRDSVRGVNPARLVCEALQRGIFFSGRRILHALQLYQPVEPLGWQTLHQLYALAERQQLTRLPLVDRQSGGSSIEGTYLQVLMLGCCKPNQLRQSDLAAIYRGLQDWVRYVHLDDPETGQGLFIVNLEADDAPMYSTMFPQTPGSQCRFIDTSDLAGHLQSLRKAPEYKPKTGLALDRDIVISDDILKHLASSLEQVSARNFTRVATSGPVEIVVGISDAHFHLAGGRSFKEVLHGVAYQPATDERINDNPFLSEADKRDLWEQANPVGEHFTAHEHDDAHPEMGDVYMDDVTRAALAGEEHAPTAEGVASTRFPVHSVQPLNASPGGYCLQWPEDFPRDVRTGEIVALRDKPDSNWTIAVIRWISTSQAGRALLGVELLSPRAEPCGIRLLDKSRDSEYLRALLLPEIRLVAQPPTLVAPRTGFREGLRVELCKDGKTGLVELRRQLAASASFGQFEYQPVSTLEQTVDGMERDKLARDQEQLPDSPYESLWNKL